MGSSSAFQARSRGRKVTLRSDWDKISHGVMYEIIAAKFSDYSIQSLLVNTKDSTLVEGNRWHDNK